MPEVPVYEDGDLLLSEHYVRRTRQGFDVLSKSQATTAKSFLDFSFERSIA